MKNQISSERALLMVFREMAVNIRHISVKNRTAIYKVSEMKGYPDLFICLGESPCGHDEKSSCWEIMIFGSREDILKDRNRLFRASAEKKDFIRINFMPEREATGQKLAEAIDAIRKQLEKLITVM